MVSECKYLDKTEPGLSCATSWSVFSHPLSRNKSNVNKWILVIHVKDIPQCCSESAPGIPDQAWHVFLSTYVPPSVFPMNEMTTPQPEVHPLAMLTKERGTFLTYTSQTEKDMIMHNPPMTDLNRFQLRVTGLDVTARSSWGYMTVTCEMLYRTCMTRYQIRRFYDCHVNSQWL